MTGAPRMFPIFSVNDMLVEIQADAGCGCYVCGATNVGYIELSFDASFEIKRSPYL